ncbi:hypothetical protein Tco_0409781 [Tanacetum coccineum]
MTSGREITPPPGFSAIPITTTMFAATTPENMPMAYRTSTSANPNPMISPAFIEANYQALESLLRDRRRQMEMEPRLEPTRAATPPLQVVSPRIRRWWETTVGFEGAQSRGESRVERNTKGGRPLEETPRGNGGQSVNLPLLLATHLGKGENGQPLQSSLTFRRNGGQAFQINIGGKSPFHNGFVHGLTTKSLVEHFSMDLPSTYKGLMENTYTWVEAREVATNGVSRDRIDSFERSKKSSRDNNRGQKNNHGLLPSLSKSLKEILATEKAARSFEPPPKMSEVSDREICPSTVTSMKITDTIPMILDTSELRFKGL